MNDIASLIQTFKPNDWRQVNIQFNAPDKIYPSTVTNKKVIDYIISKFPQYDFKEACYLVKNGLTEGGKCKRCNTKVPFRPDNKAAPYKTYCSSACRNADIGNPQAESIVIDGVKFKDFQTAIDALGLSRSEIRHRIFDSNYPTWVWDTDDHNAKCLDKLRDIDPRLCDKQFIIRWKESKQPFGCLVDQIGKSADTVRYALTYHGIDSAFEQIPEAAKSYRDNKSLLEELYRTKTTEEIAIQLGIAAKTVQNWIRAHGIAMDYSKSQSAIEREFIDYFKTKYPALKIIERCRDVLDGVEIDIYFPDHNLAIEFDGLRYHSEPPTTANKNKHAYKQKMCFSKGIQLLNFTDIGDTMPSHKKDIVRSIIEAKLGNTSRIYARHCSLVDVNGRDANVFFTENHISGNRQTSRYIGLTYKGELVMVMSFGKPISKNSHEWEIVRMACKKYHTVIGGASKIFKEFLRTSSGNVMSYANLRFGNGNVYTKLGFRYVKNTGPGYSYTDMKSMFSRHMFQKHNIAKMCPMYNPSLTESENAEANGYTVYWDCGHLLFEYIRQ